MLKQLQIQDLILGELDAKDEIMMSSPEERERFAKTFLIPEGINLNDFLKGKLSFITGLKGIGKTALLRYIALEAEKELHAHTSFILFKSDFVEEDKKDFAKVGDATVYNTEGLTDEVDYVAIWKWFIHRHIVQEIVSKEYELFVDDKQWQRYKTCVLLPNLENEDIGIKRFLPKLKRGTFEIGANWPDIKAKLGLDFEFEDRDKTKIKFNSIVRQADLLFSKLSCNGAKLFVFVDELELSFITQKLYERDMKLIRDLVVAVEQINSLAREMQFGIKIICAIRSEVIKSIQSTGKEINKIVEGFGQTISWHKYDNDRRNNPLMKMMIKRIIVSESLFGNELSTSEAWEKWFPKQYQGKPIEEYILHHSWYRPRDIVRLLKTAKNFFAEETRFSHKVFDTIRKDYSAASFVEMSEELRAIYRIEELEGIKSLLNGFSEYFTLAEFNQRIMDLKELYGTVEVLFDRFKSGKILTDLYRVGIIGNILPEGHQRWASRGDDDLLLEYKMTIHRALFAHLSIVKKRYPKKKLESKQI